MPCMYLFADEAGDFKFRSGENISRYFILCTIRTTCCDIGTSLHDLRRDMLLRGSVLGDKFHCSSDRQSTRDEVFALLQRHEFRIDATILEKRKARPHVCPDGPTFYQYAWHYHAKYVVPRSMVDGHDLFICAAALETSKGKAAFKLAFNNVIQQTAPRTRWATDFPPSASEPCLQAADYCAWAIQRKWEMGDTRSYGVIANKIATEFDLWRTGASYYYV